MFAMGCSGPQMTDEVERTVEVPESFAVGADESSVVKGDTWCSDFGPELNGLIEVALAENMDVLAAWARVQQAEAIHAQANASLFPTVSVQASAARSKSPAPMPLGSVEGNSFQLSAPMSYEIDLFGKLAAQREASELDVQAQRADVETLAITVAAQVSEAWLDVLFQRRRVLLVTEQIATAEKYLELTMLRLSQGLATALDVNQQRADIHGLEARREQATVAEEVARLRLKALLGASSESAKVDMEQFPVLGPRLQPGTPATVIEQRPDVRAAMIRLQAADARTAQAARDRLPTLRLSGNVFLQAAELGNLFDDLFWSIGAQVVQPIFEGGRRQARVDQQVAAARERLYVYAKSVIQAVQEVESSMVQEVAQERLRDLLQQQKEVAEVSLELARDRYRSGALDYLRVLTALRSLQAAEQSLLDAERQQFSFRIQTCRALGGGWTQSLQAPQENQ